MRDDSSGWPLTGRVLSGLAPGGRKVIIAPNGGDAWAPAKPALPKRDADARRYDWSLLPRLLILAPGLLTIASAWW